MMRVGMMREMGWQVDEKVNRDKTGEADGMNLKVDSKDEEMVGGRERVTTDEERVLR